MQNLTQIYIVYEHNKGEYVNNYALRVLKIHAFAFLPFASKLLASLSGSPQIEAIDEVHHEVGIDGIAFGVRSAHGADGAADVASLVQDVVSL